MTFTLKQLYALTEGKLSTSMNGIYDMLGAATGTKGLMTHHLPVAINYVREKNPEWYSEAKKLISEAIEKSGSSDFHEHMKAIDRDHKDTMIYITNCAGPDFEDYMLKNSLLLKRVSG